MKTGKTAWNAGLINRQITDHRTRQKSEWLNDHILKGKSMNRNSVQFISNDYLSIAGHHDITSAMREALSTPNASTPLMSAVFLEETDPQRKLERDLASWLEADETMLCQSGYAANTGLIQTIINDQNLPVYIDMMAHMSLWDGIKLGGGVAHTFRHNSPSHLSKLIAKHGPGLVIVDSVYSTSGGICPLKDIVNLAHDTECVMLVDESHSLGTHGYQGKGLVPELGLCDKVHFRTASLAKAFAGRAGIVTMPAGYKDVFTMTAKTFIFSSALLPAEIAGLAATYSLIRRSDKRREKLQANVEFVRSGLSDLGFDLGESETQIIPLEAGSELAAIELRKVLEANGVFGSPFCTPATPKNRTLLRLSISAGHSQHELARLLDACARLAERSDAGQWRCLRNRNTIREHEQLASAA